MISQAIEHEISPSPTVGLVPSIYSVPLGMTTHSTVWKLYKYTLAFHTGIQVCADQIFTF